MFKRGEFSLYMCLVLPICRRAEIHEKKQRNTSKTQRKTSTRQRKTSKIENPVQDFDNPAQYIETSVQGIENPARDIENPAKAIENQAQAIENPVPNIENSAQDTENPTQDTQKKVQDIGYPAQAIENPEQDMAKTVQHIEFSCTYRHGRIRQHKNLQRDTARSVNPNWNPRPTVSGLKRPERIRRQPCRVTLVTVPYVSAPCKSGARDTLQAIFRPCSVPVQTLFRPSMQPLYSGPLSSPYSGNHQAIIRHSSDPMQAPLSQYSGRLQAFSAFLQAL